MATLVRERNKLVLTESETEALRANAVRELDNLAWVGSDGSTVPLPAELTEVLRLALSTLSSQGKVSLTTPVESVSSTTAAEILGISRPTLLKLARQGAIASFKIGSHTRFSYSALKKFKQERESAKKSLLLDIIELGEEIDGKS